MTVRKGDLYEDREQTRVKHYILERYLERFAFIIGSWANAITYVDGFSGPWDSHATDLSDSSFSVAIEQLRKARTALEANGKTLKTRCFFVERSRSAYQKLKAFADGVRDMEIETKYGEFEESIDDVLRFIEAGGPKSFPFIFIDPKGWTGFPIDRIEPLLQLTPVEVLVNFMTEHIRRFIESPQEQTQDSFQRLFGSAAYREQIAGLERQEREDTLVRAYLDTVRTAGKFEFICPAIILHGEMDRTHYHLLYATRSEKGVEVFKAVEKKAMSVMEAARAEAHKRKRQKGGQLELLSAEAMHDPRYYDKLRDRYLAAAQRRVERLLVDAQTSSYDRAWKCALSYPLVWESDLKDWIKEWRAAGLLELVGMAPRQSVPRRKQGIQLVWKGPRG